MSSIAEQFNNATVIRQEIPDNGIPHPDEGIISCDTETTGLDFNGVSYFNTGKYIIRYNGVKIFGISAAYHHNTKLFLIWARIGTELFPKVCAMIGSRIGKTWHNARFDLRALKENRIKVSGKQHCTLTMSRIYWDRRKKHSLEKLTEFICPELCDLKDPAKDKMRKLKSHYTREGCPEDYVNYSFLPDEIISRRAMLDAYIGLVLYERLYPIMIKDFADLYKEEMNVLRIVSTIEERGLAFDYKRAETIISKLIKEITKCRKSMRSFAGKRFNPASPKQVLEFLKSAGVKTKELTLKGKVTTGADVVRFLATGKDQSECTRSFSNALLLYRAYTKTINTYLIPLYKKARANKGIIYTSINPADTRTGRMTSTDPNLQNIPTLNPRRGRTAGGENPTRSCFICRPGYANYYFDYANMEMVIFGLYAQDELILKTYQAGEDIHGKMAGKLYGSNYTREQRDRTKDTNFGVIYGMGIREMARVRSVSIEEAKEFLNMYHNTFPSIKKLLDFCRHELQNKGYVEDFFGKRYHVPYGQVYKAVNCLVQGGCARIFKKALISLDKIIRDFISTKILLPVHDEFQVESKVWEEPKTEKVFIKRFISEMTQIPEILDRGLKLRVDVSRSITNWAEKKPFEI